MTSFMLCSSEEVQVFRSLGSLTDFAEPTDVLASEYEVFDSTGLRYSLGVRKESRRGLWGLGKTVVDVTYAESVELNIRAYLDRVLSFLERLEPGEPMPETVELATQKLVDMVGYVDDT